MFPQFVAMKLYAVVPNSMAEEHTASVFTQINSPLCNKQTLSMIENLVQIKQFYGLSTEVWCYLNTYFFLLIAEFHYLEGKACT